MNFITRQEIAAMMVRALDFKNLDGIVLSAEQINEQLNKFIDADKISPWARESVARVIKADIIKGNLQLMGLSLLILFILQTELNIFLENLKK